MYVQACAPCGIRIGIVIGLTEIHDEISLFLVWLVTVIRSWTQFLEGNVVL